jgi:hypothetical protein
MAQLVGYALAIAGMLVVFFWAAISARLSSDHPAPQPAPPPSPQPRPPVFYPVYFFHLDLHRPFTRDEVLAAYRRQAKRLHPDAGGWEDRFRNLVVERDKALTLAD